MSTRTRFTRGLASSSSVTPMPESSSSKRRTRGQIKPEITSAESEEEISEPGPSRLTARGSRGKIPIFRSKAVKLEVDDEDQDEKEDEGGDQSAEGEDGGHRMRVRKSVSYKEIPVEVDLGDEDEDEVDDVAELAVEAEEEEEEDAEGEDDEKEEGEDTVRATRSSVSAPGTPSKSTSDIRGTPQAKGGFSVKGAASAAAKARWDKVRREKRERGEESDEGDKKRIRPGAGDRKSSKAAVDSLPIDSTYWVKGTEYTVGDDELVLPDDEKGEAKIDAEGNLLGGREYKLQTFTSTSRRNPSRIYALTIDVARACGYSDSLAFLRRVPTLIKLTASTDERSMLIEIGRVTGNLRNRNVTIICMRNVFKVMGARVIKGGKWVTDDYYEDKSLAECTENGFTPYTLAHDDDILTHALSGLPGTSRPTYQSTHADPNIARALTNLTPFYTLGGPTTQFAGNGADPWSEAGGGNKRAKLRVMGLSHEDWMLRVAEECRRVDADLREYREERMKVLEGEDGRRGWVWALEDGDGNGAGSTGQKQVLEGLRPPVVRKRSGLSQEVTLEDGDDTVMEDGEKAEEEPEGDEVEKTPGGTIVIETAETRASWRAKCNGGVGKAFEPKVIRAVYEPHTHMPHVPQHTQPSMATRDRIAPYPILTSLSDSDRKNFVQSTVVGRPAQGLSSLEYVFDPPLLLDSSARAGKDEVLKRLREVEAAEEWEREARKRRRVQTEVAPTSVPA